MLKYFTLLGRFPTGRAELAEEAVGFVACQVRVPVSELLGARQRDADEADRRGLAPLFWSHVLPTTKSASTWRRGWPCVPDLRGIGGVR